NSLPEVTARLYCRKKLLQETLSAILNLFFLLMVDVKDFHFQISNASKEKKSGSITNAQKQQLYCEHR
ncbi:unnamed protein product, partial [Larinioides sclopetarius]